MKKRDFKNGFTIIEVVLVLAVAGLIFIMVFVALPALQRSQRDNARRDDLMNFVSQVKKYQTNNRGALPGKGNNIGSGAFLEVGWSEDLKNSTGNQDTWGGFYRDYLGERFIDPDGESYRLVVMNCEKSVDVSCTGHGNFLTGLKDTSFPNDYKIMVVLQAKCNGLEAVGSSSPRNLAVVYRMEGSGSYCFNT